MKGKDERKFWGSVGSYVLSFLFILSWACIGIALALSTAGVNLGGDITFTATDIYAIIKGKVTGTKTANNPEDIHIDSSTKNFTTPSSWTSLYLDFDKNNNIEIEITFENLSTDVPMWVSINDNISSDNLTITKSVAGSTVQNFTQFEVGKAGTSSSIQTAKIAMSVTNENLSIDGDFDLKIDLFNEEPKSESEYSSLFTFSNYDTTNMTVGVGAKDTTISGDITIPSSIIHDGEVYKVTEIAANGFESAVNITSCKIPNTVTTIGQYAFHRCTGLTSIEVPGSVKTIGDYAFARCFYATSLKLSEGIQEIGTYAFMYCGYYTPSTPISLNIPASVTSIANGNPFNGSAGITEITVTSGNSRYYSSGNAVIDNTTEKLIIGCKTTTIADSVKVIGNAAFIDMDITSITIPANVVVIEDYAFDATSLTSVTFENTEGWSVDGTEIESSALVSGSTAANTLKSKYNKEWRWETPVRDASVYSDLTFTQIGSTTNVSVKVADASTISGSVVIPYKVKISGETYTVTQVEANGFQNAANITSLELPSTITSIGNRAFFNNTALTSIDIPGNVKSIGDYAFAYCAKVGTIILNEGIESIGSYAFMNCGRSSNSSIEIIIPASVTSISSNPFTGVLAISSFTVASGNANYYAGGNAIIEKASQTLVSGCKNTTIIDAVKTIGAYAMSNIGIKSITIPANVTTIKSNAFGSTSAWTLTSATFAKTEGWSANGSDIESSKLASGSTAAQTLKDNLAYVWTWIDPSIKNASEYTNLTFTKIGSTTNVNVKAKSASTISGDVVIPEKVKIDGTVYIVTEIAESGFEGAVNVTSYTLPNTITTINKWAFKAASATSYPSWTTINLPSGLKTLDGAAFTNCKALASITIPETVELIGNSVFMNCSALKEITIPNSVTSLGSSVFENCSGLTTVKLSENISELKSSTFYLCSSLESIEIPASVKTIGDSALRSCAALKTVVIKGAETIGGAAFYNSGVTNVTLNEGLKTIGAAAFNDTKLEALNLPASLTSFEANGNGDRLNLRYLTSITVASGNTTYMSSQNCLIEKSTKTLIIGCKNSVIPANNSVTIIDSKAFEGCSLSAFTIPANITTIRANAFRYVVSGVITFANTDGWTAGTTPLSSSDLANTTTALTYLRSNYVAVDWTWIEPVKDASEYSDLTFTKIGSTTNVSVKAADASTISGDIVIPEKVKIDGTVYTVTEIAASGFKNATNLTYCILPNTITAIQSYAFSLCTNLTGVELPTSVKTIAANAFEYCRNASYLILNEGLETIGHDAFGQFGRYSSSTSLVLNIPASVTSIYAGNPFYSSGFTAITVTSGNTKYYSSGNAIIETATQKLITACKNTTIDSSVQTICKYSFYCEITNITIPSSVTTIEANAFYNYSNFTSATFENTEGWSIAGTALDSSLLASGSTAANKLKENCAKEWTWIDPVKDVSEYTNITFTQIGSTTNVSVKATNASTISGDVVIPDKVKIDGTVYTVTEIAQSGFADAINVTSYTLPETITVINDYAFQATSASSYPSWTTISLPSGITAIATGTFRNCKALTSITLPNGVETIGTGAFYNSGLTSITLNEGLKTIQANAFNEAKLTSLSLPASLTSFVANSSGQRLNSGYLTSITVASGNTTFRSIDNCLIEISTKTIITGCKNSVIPTDASIVTTIGSNAFYGCSLSTLTISSNITTIEANAFLYAWIGSTTFTNTDGWTAGTTPLSSTDLKNTATASTYLRNTYVAVAWKRS